VSRTGAHRWRSALFVPGSNARALEKSASLPADIFIFDLEDAVAPAEKADARQTVADRLGQRAGGARLCVRVNAIATDWFDGDVRMAVEAGADAIILPKAEGPDDVRALRGQLSILRSKAPVWAMIETPLGLLHLREMALTADETGLTALIAGANDLRAELRARAMSGRTDILPHLAAILATARAAGLAALDSVYNDFSDTEGFAAEARQGCDLGFDGKTLIHPSQIEAANAAFSPSQGERDWARRVIEAFEAADGKGVAVLDGEMIEELHVRRARALLAAYEEDMTP